MLALFGIIDDATGTLERVVVSPDGYDLGGKTVVEAPADYDGASANYVIAAGAFVPNVELVRSAAKARVMATRDEVEFGGCATPLGAMDSDPYSQAKIGGAVQAATLATIQGEPLASAWSIDWTMADNSVVTHDAPAMIAAGLAIASHVGACHIVGRNLKNLIDAALTVAEVEAVDVECAPWP